MTPQPTPTAIRLLGALLVAGVLTPWPALAQGDVAAGKALYDRRCFGCHGDAKTRNTQGPSLVGVVGRMAGTAGGGATSRALTESGIVWNEASLQQFLAEPGDKVHGTIMPVGTQRPQDRDDLIAYLKTLR